MKFATVMSSGSYSCRERINISPLLIFLLAFMSAAACAMPDLKRGQAALERGDRVAAEREFRPLAEFGLPDAQIMLGDLLSSGPLAGRRTAEAMRWYMRAAPRDSRGYGRVASLYARDLTLDAAEMDKLIDQLVTRYERGDLILAGDIAALLLARGGGHNFAEVKTWANRALDNGDMRAHLQLGQICDLPLAKPEQPACAQAHYRKASRFSPDAAGRLVASLQRHPEMGSPVKEAEELKQHFLPPERYTMYRLYWRNVAKVPQIGVAEMLLGDLFNESTRSTHTSMAKAAELVDPVGAEITEDDIYDPTDAAIELASAYTKSPGEAARQKFLKLLPYLRKVRPLEAALLEADVYISGNLMPADPHYAEKILLPWGDKSPAAAFALGNLYRNGFLDETNYEVAIHYYERAGRGGLGQGWYALTRLYLGAKAFSPDRARAEKYAALARKAGYLQVDYLLESVPVGGALEQ